MSNETLTEVKSKALTIFGALLFFSIVAAVSYFFAY
jgi:hypothetical protein